MITTIQQAKKVQAKRFASGKLGVSKAVRRFFNRDKKLFSLNHPMFSYNLEAKFEGCKLKKGQTK